jgi:geranylgeranyl diphosphate synthase, type I
MANWYVETFGKLLLDIDSAIRDFASQHEHKAPIFWQQAHEHFDWAYPDARASNQGFSSAGKRIRPLLMALVARSLSATYEHVIPAAIGLEVIHNFTLIHDDIMDESLERRHRPTIWSRYGIAQAINTGDGLYSIGILSSLNLVENGVSAEKALRASQILMTACLDTVQGQALDLQFEERNDISPEEYLTMIRLKTGRFIETATQLGALLSSDDPVIIEHYANFGKYLGWAFQMWDDYLGIWGDPDVIGKSATSDIEQKKKSYPITLAFANASDNELRHLQAMYSKERLEEDDVAQVLGVLDILGIREKTESYVDEYHEKAMNALNALALDNEDYANLKKLAQFIIQREY